MKKLGFTLAEVLMTLAIIGVVAALTIPAVITKVTQDQYVVGLKKAYNTLKSVEREAIQENGPMEDWAWSTERTHTAFNTYFKPHFDILKDCGSDTDEGCFSNEYSKIDGSNEANDLNTSKYSRIITSDGISYAYYNYGTRQYYKGYFVVDVNGKKMPNMSGRDLFFFMVYTDIGIKPEGAFNSPSANEHPVPESDTDSTCISTGRLCTAKVIAEGVMNY